MSKDVGFRVSVVLPASGTGERMGMCKPKQFCEALGRPLIAYTIATFHRIPWIQDIIVTVSEGYQELMKQIVSDYNYNKVKVVAGGPTRHRSIYNGVKAVENVCDKPEVVLIHDAVRIFCEEDLVKEIAESAQKYGACGVSRPLVSTVIASDSNGMLTESLDRSQYTASEMPQGFKYHVIREAYDKSTDFDFDYGTECLLLAKKYCGVEAFIVKGKPYLWKVTHKKDLFAAEGMLKESMIKVSIRNSDHQTLANSLEQCLTAELSPHQVRQEDGTEDKQTTDISTNTVIHINQVSNGDKPIQVTDIPHLGERTLLDHCHIHVLLVDSNQIGSLHHGLCLHYKELAASIRSQHLLLFAVVAKLTDNPADITSIVKHLVFDRRAAFSGQVFLV